MANYLQLKNQIQKLQKEAEILRKRERIEMIVKIKEAIATYDLTLEDLGLLSTIGRPQKRKAPGQPAGMETLSDDTLHGRKAKKSVIKNKRPGRKAGKRSSGADKRSVVAPKYRDATTGSTWTGRGKQPKWLSTAIKSGRRLEDFRI